MIKCRYCDYVPDTHYKGGRLKPDYMIDYWMRDHVDKNHSEMKVLERDRQARREANDAEHKLRLWERW